MRNSRYAKTPFERANGIMVGKDRFKFNKNKSHNMTMNTPMGTVPFPIQYMGLHNGKVTDSGIAYPGQNFKVKGSEVREYPLYRKGGRFYSKGSMPWLRDGHDKKYQSGDVLKPLPTLSRLSGVTSIGSPSPITYQPENNKPYPYGRFSSMTGLSNPFASKTSSDFSHPFYSRSDIKPNNSLLDKTGRGFKSAYNKYKDYMNSHDPYKAQLKDFPIASTIYNVSQGLKKTKEKPEYNRYATNALSGLKQLKYKPNFNPLYLQTKDLSYKINNSTSSVAGKMANLQNAYGNMNRAIIDETRNAANINNQYKQNYYNALYGEGAQRAQERRRIVQNNLQHEATRRHHLGQAAQTFDQFRGLNRDLRNRKISDQMNLAAINAKNPDSPFMFDDNYNLIQMYRDKNGKLRPVGS